MSPTVLALAAAALFAAAPATSAPTEERIVETSRVVVRVTDDPAGQSYDYVFVDHEDGEPVLLDAVVADRGYLGVTLLDLTPELREHFGAPAEAGVMISRVEPESPAARSGLQAGDVLIAFDGARVDSATTAVQLVSGGRQGQIIEIDIRRDGVSSSVSATLETRRRRQLDLGGLLAGAEGDGRVLEHRLRMGTLPMVELDPESMGRALSLMREHFESPEWREQVKRFGGDREALQERIQQLEKRLRELERQLDDLPE